MAKLFTVEKIVNASDVTRKFLTENKKFFVRKNNGNHYLMSATSDKQIRLSDTNYKIMDCDKWCFYTRNSKFVATVEDIYVDTEKVSHDTLRMAYRKAETNDDTRLNYDEILAKLGEDAEYVLYPVFYNYFGCEDNNNFVGMGQFVPTRNKPFGFVGAGEAIVYSDIYRFVDVKPYSHCFYHMEKTKKGKKVIAMFPNNREGLLDCVGPYDLPELERMLNEKFKQHQEKVAKRDAERAEQRRQRELKELALKKEHEVALSKAKSRFGFAVEGIVTQKGGNYGRPTITTFKFPRDMERDEVVEYLSILGYKEYSDKQWAPIQVAHAVIDGLGNKWEFKDYPEYTD